MRILSVAIKSYTTIGYDEMQNNKLTMYTLKTKEQPHPDFINAFANLKGIAIETMGMSNDSARVVSRRLQIKHDKLYWRFTIEVSKNTEFGTSIMKTPWIDSNSNFVTKDAQVRTIIDNVIHEAEAFLKGKRDNSQPGMFDEFAGSGVVTDGKLEISYEGEPVQNEDNFPPEEIVNAFKKKSTENIDDVVSDILTDIIDDVETVNTQIPDEIKDEISDDFPDDDVDQTVPKTGPARGQRKKQIIAKAKSKTKKKK